MRKSDNGIINSAIGRPLEKHCVPSLTCFITVDDNFDDGAISDGAISDGAISDDISYKIGI
tara:strand:- start:1223 stop:1405 length:183 start_codon:yes stop_codon:yes gene_type:complete